MMWPSGLQLSVWNSVLHPRLLNDSVWPFTPPNNLLYRARAILRLRQIRHQYHSLSTHCQLRNEGTKKEQERQKSKPARESQFSSVWGGGVWGGMIHIMHLVLQIDNSKLGSTQQQKICWHLHVARIISSQKIYGLYAGKHHTVEMRGDVTMRDKQLKIELLSQWKLEAEFRN